MGSPPRRACAVAVLMCAGFLAGQGSPAAAGDSALTPETPVPTVARLTDVTALSPTDAWAVGFTASATTSHTLVKHWDGTSWIDVSSPNPGGQFLNVLNSVTAVSPDDVWAVGYYTDSLLGVRKTLTLHWDGSSWAYVASPNFSAKSHTILQAVDNISAKDVWAVGYRIRSLDAIEPAAFTLHWDGATWVDVDIAHRHWQDPLYGVAAINATDIWAVGQCITRLCVEPARRSVVEHGDGASWTWTPTPGLGHLQAVSAASPSDVWAVGDGTISHYDGSAWRAVRSPRIGALSDVDALTSTFAMAVSAGHAEQWDGARWRRVQTANLGVLSAVSLDSPTDGWAVGSNGSHSLLEHWDGSSFTADRTGSGRSICYRRLLSDSGFSPLSAKVQDAPEDDSSGAADFTVKRSCTIKVLNVFGEYFNGSTPAQSETVTFYRDEAGLPGQVINEQTVIGADSNGAFIIPIRALHLTKGTYHVGVQANVTSLSQGAWGWNLSTLHSGNLDVWENPGGGARDCRSWIDIHACFDVSGSYDFMVSLTR